MQQNISKKNNADVEFPVVIIHRGYSNYLKWAILQAKRYNSRVVLIGDDKNERLKEYVEFFHINKFTSSLTSKFSNVYKHMSTNTFNFEFICFERWFLLLKFMETEYVNMVVHLDSDVMLYDTLNVVFKEFDKNTLAAYHIPEQTFTEKRWTAGGSASMWTMQGLVKFCTFIVDSYKSDINLLRNKWNWHLSSSMQGGICDMTLLYLFYLKHKFEIINLAKTSINELGQNYTVELQLNTSENYYKDEFAMSKSKFLFKIKDIVHQNGRIKGYNNFLNDYVIFTNLHCQGSSKILMYFFYEGDRNLKDKVEYAGFVCSYIWYKILNKTICTIKKYRKVPFFNIV